MRSRKRIHLIKNNVEQKDTTIGDESVKYIYRKQLRIIYYYSQNKMYSIRIHNRNYFKSVIIR